MSDLQFNTLPQWVQRNVLRDVRVLFVPKPWTLYTRCVFWKSKSAFCLFAFMLYTVPSFMVSASLHLYFARVVGCSLARLLAYLLANSDRVTHFVFLNFAYEIMSSRPDSFFQLTFNPLHTCCFWKKQSHVLLSWSQSWIHYAMLCHVCYGTPSYAMICYALFNYALLCYAMLR